MMSLPAMVFCHMQSCDYCTGRITTSKKLQIEEMRYSICMRKKALEPFQRLFENTIANVALCYERSRKIILSRKMPGKNHPEAERTLQRVSVIEERQFPTAGNANKRNYVMEQTKISKYCSRKKITSSLATCVSYSQKRVMRSLLGNLPLSRFFFTFDDGKMQSSDMKYASMSDRRTKLWKI